MNSLDLMNLIYRILSARIGWEDCCLGLILHREELEESDENTAYYR